MHPYRGGPARIGDDDRDVHAYARSARRLQRTSMGVALVGALVIAWLIVDWPVAYQALSRLRF